MAGKRFLARTGCPTKEKGGWGWGGRGGDCIGTGGLPTLQRAAPGATPRPFKPPRSRPVESWRKIHAWRKCRIAPPPPPPTPLPPPPHTHAHHTTPSPFLQGSKGPTGLYEKWAKKTRLRVAVGGAEEGAAQLAAQMKDRWAEGLRKGRLAGQLTADCLVGVPGWWVPHCRLEQDGRQEGVQARRQCWAAWATSLPRAGPAPPAGHLARLSTSDI